MFVFLPSQARARSHAAARLAQSCPGRILLRARRAWACLPSRGRPCDGPGFVPVNRGRPSARSAELQAIHRRPLQNPRSPLHKAPPNPTSSVRSPAVDGVSQSPFRSRVPTKTPLVQERFRAPQENDFPSARGHPFLLTWTRNAQPGAPHVGEEVSRPRVENGANATTPASHEIPPGSGGTYSKRFRAGPRSDC